MRNKLSYLMWHCYFKQIFNTTSLIENRFDIRLLYENIYYSNLLTALCDLLEYKYHNYCIKVLSLWEARLQLANKKCFPSEYSWDITAWHDTPTVQIMLCELYRFTFQCVTIHFNSLCILNSSTQVRLLS